jgi:hypothetical protein
MEEGDILDNDSCENPEERSMSPMDRDTFEHLPEGVDPTQGIHGDALEDGRINICDEYEAGLGV